MLTYDDFDGYTPSNHERLDPKTFFTVFILVQSYLSE